MKQKISIIKSLLLITAINFLFIRCNNKANEEIWKNKLDSLNAITNTRDSIINDFLISFNEIESSLDSVSKRQMIIMKNAKTNNEIKSSTRERINQDILLINELMEENRKKIGDLTKKLKSSTSKLITLEKTLDMLREQLSQKDAELIVMNDKLSTISDSMMILKVSVDTLTKIGQSQAQFISEQTKELHTAYYVIGERKELQEKKIIDSEGGILGLGKTQKIAENVNNQNFKKIDYTVTTIIPVNSKKVKLLTSHPNDSYIMDKNEDGEVTALRVTTPQKFWGVSKYLVVLK